MYLLTRINSYNPSFHIKEPKQIGCASQLRMRCGTVIKPAILTEVQCKAKYDIKYYTEDLEQFLWVSKRVHGSNTEKASNSVRRKKKKRKKGKKEKKKRKTIINICFHPAVAYQPFQSILYTLAL